MRRIPLLAAATAVTAVTAGIATPALADAFDRRGGAAPAAAATTAVPQSYLDQTITWTPCYPDGRPAGLPEGSEALQCGTFRTPRDWNNAGAGADLEIAVSRLTPGDEAAKGIVLTNPGGPGGEGRTTPLFFLQAKSPVLAQRDVIGIDVRGTGESTNVTCRSDEAGVVPRNVRDRSADNVNALVDEVVKVTELCQSDPLSPYITTEQTVRDYDLLRQILHRPTIDWVGYSGGTWLGAAYATYFPAQVGRFVLDSNTEFTGTWEDSFTLQPMSMERRLRQDYFPWVAKYDAVFGLGKSARKVSASYEKLRAQVVKKPVEITVGEGDEAFTLEVGPSLLDGIIGGGLYSKANFEGTTQMWLQVQEAAGGTTATVRKAAASADKRLDPADARALVDAATTVAPTGAADAGDAVFNSILCNDTPWATGKDALVRKSAALLRKYPFRGGYSIYNPCAFWDRSKVTSLAPRTGQGVPNVLMVQSEHDPATATEGAFAARRKFAGARMLFVKGEGDHGVYLGSNTCVDDKVNAFLLAQAEAADGVCAGVGLPVPEGVAAKASERSDQVAASPLMRATRWSIPD